MWGYGGKRNKIPMNIVPQEQRRNCRVQLGGEGTAVWRAKRRLGIEDRIGRIAIV